LAEIPADIGKMNFEDALKELEGIVRQLEDGKGRLDEAIDAYTRGALLKRHCEAKLAEAEARIEKIVLGPDGAVSVAPANLG
jgi:exodeoxyribonuclease VII small subunit